MTVYVSRRGLEGRCKHNAVIPQIVLYQTNEPSYRLCPMFHCLSNHTTLFTLPWFCPGRRDLCAVGEAPGVIDQNLSFELMYRCDEGPWERGVESEIFLQEKGLVPPISHEHKHSGAEWCAAWANCHSLAISRRCANRFGRGSVKA